MDMNIHEETLKIARNLIKKDPSLTDWVISKFPELKEREDEGIRKELIAYCQINMGHSWHNIKKEDYITWLKKQYEPTDINPSEFDLRLNKLLKQFETLPREELASILRFYLNVVQNDGTYREEKKGKQKPDKIQLGKKYKCIASPRYSTFILGKIYKPKDEFLCNLMNFCSDCFEPIEDSEQDENKLSPFEEELFSAFSDGWQKFLNDEQGLDITEWAKEHSALLLKAAKQELKKIENEIEIPFGAKDSELQEAIYYIPKGFHAEIDDDKVVIKKGEKSAVWSEEDEEYLNFVIATIKTLQVKCTENEIKHHSNNQAAPYYAKVINWLKFIRPQKYVGYNPYKATVESIAEMCKHYDVANHSGLRDFYDNVKVKCKEAIEYDKKYSQRQWRPSNKQLNALDSVLQYGQISNNSKEDLNSLYNDLKQL